MLLLAKKRQFVFFTSTSRLANSHSENNNECTASLEPQRLSLYEVKPQRRGPITPLSAAVRNTTSQMCSPFPGQPNKACRNEGAIVMHL